jgi:hypothetical protein
VSASCVSFRAWQAPDFWKVITMRVIVYRWPFVVGIRVGPYELLLRLVRRLPPPALTV